MPDYRERTRLQFGKQWDDPTSVIFQWYSAQPFSQFRTIQYCKERIGVQHEFVLILLLDGQGFQTGSFCRLDRTADPMHQFESIGPNGTAAYDFIQTCESYTAEFASNEQHKSDIVAEIEFPSTRDLRDVLAICYGISSHKTARRYTLQQFNCYFFSWAIILCLVRSSFTLQEPFDQIVKDIQESLSSSFSSLRSTKMALILAQTEDIETYHRSEEQTSLTDAIMAELSSTTFLTSMDRLLQSMLWQDRRTAIIKTTLQSSIQNVAGKTVEILTRAMGKRPLDDDKVARYKQNAQLRYYWSRFSRVARLQLETEPLVCRIVMEILAHVHSQRFSSPKEYSTQYNQALRDRRHDQSIRHEENSYPCKRSLTCRISTTLIKACHLGLSPFGILTSSIYDAFTAAYYDCQVAVHTHKNHAKGLLLVVPDTIKHFPLHLSENSKRIIGMASARSKFLVEESFRVARLGDLEIRRSALLIPGYSEHIAHIVNKHEALDARTLYQIVVWVLSDLYWCLSMEQWIDYKVLWGDILAHDLEGPISEAISDVVAQQTCGEVMKVKMVCGCVQV